MRKTTSSRRSRRVLNGGFATVYSSWLDALAKAWQGMWLLARLDLLLWRRMPWAIAGALLPPLGMALMLIVLSLTVTQEPVALVLQSQGAYSRQMTEMLQADSDSYALSVMSMP